MSCMASAWQASSLVRRASKKNFDIRPIDGKGLGVIAQRDISQGEMILEDQPLLTIPCDDMDSLTDDDIEKMLEALPKEKQEHFWKLFDAHIFGESERPSAKSRVLTNSYPVEDAEGNESFAVFNTVARFNHSCVPNVHNTWDFDTQTETLYAVQDIRQGQELCTTYLQPMDLYRPTDERRSILQRCKFRCGCEACSLLGVEAEESDRRRRDLRRFSGELEQLEENEDLIMERDRLIEVVEEAIKLIDVDLKANSALKCRIYSAGFQMAAELGDVDLTSKLVKKALRHVLLCEGPASPNAIMLGQCAQFCG